MFARSEGSASVANHASSISSRHRLSHETAHLDPPDLLAGGRAGQGHLVTARSQRLDDRVGEGRLLVRAQD